MLVTFHKTVLLLLVCTCSGLPVNGQNKTTGWKNKQADICFLLDCSSSVWIADYNRLKNYVADLVSEMDIRPSATRVGVGVYSENYSQHISINNSLSKDDLKNEIKNAPYLKGNGYLSRALKGLREQCFNRNEVRSQVPQIAVLFTDGMSRHKQLTADNATLVKKEGIFIFTIGISTEVDKEELRMVASDPKTTFNYYVPDFLSLTSIRSKLLTSMSEVELFQGEEGTCGEKVKIDTVFVFDETAVGENVARKIKTFIKAVVNNLSVNSGNARIGVVSKTCHGGDIGFGQFVTKENFAAGLDENTGPEISEIFKRTRLNSFLPENGARSDAKSRIVLILHANVVKKNELMREANRAQYAGIEVFVIQLGNDYDKDVVNSLASSINNIVYADTVDDLLKPNTQKEFDSQFCRDL